MYITPPETIQVKRYEAATKVNFQCLKILMLMSGWRLFNEWIIYAAAAAMKTAVTVIVAGFTQPSDATRSMRRTRAATAANMRNVPIQSNGFFTGGVFGCGIKVRAQMTAAIPMGIFKRNIQCHDKYSVMIPPSGGPKVRAIPPVVAMTPIPSPRFVSGRKRVIISGAAAAIIDAPTP